MNEQTIRELGEFILRNPTSAWAYNDRAIAYRRKGGYDQDIKDYDTAIRLNPKNADYYKYRGYAYDGRGKDNKAIEELPIMTKVIGIWLSQNSTKPSDLLLNLQGRFAIIDFTIYLTCPPI